MSELKKQIADAIRTSGFSVQGTNTHPIDELAEHIVRYLTTTHNNEGAVVLLPGEVPKWLELDCEVKRLQPDGKFGFMRLYRLTATEGAEK